VTIPKWEQEYPSQLVRFPDTAYVALVTALRSGAAAVEATTGTLRVNASFGSLRLALTWSLCAGGNRAVRQLHVGPLDSKKSYLKKSY
jgi:hypothetical protein